MTRTPYKWFNINRIGPGKRVNGKSGKAETTIFWAHYLGNCRTVGTYSFRRNHGRVTALRQTEKTVDTQHWRVDRLRIHSAKGDVTRSSTIEKKRYRSGRLLSPTLIEEGRLVSECECRRSVAYLKVGVVLAGIILSVPLIWGGVKISNLRCICYREGKLLIAPQNIGIMFGTEKLRWCGYRMTDTQMDTTWWHRPRLCIALCGEKTALEVL